LCILSRRVLVVFAAVLCVLLAALTMAYSVNVDRITADYMREVERRNNSDNLYKTQSSQFADREAKLNLDVQKLNDDKTQLGTQIAQLQGERDRAAQGQVRRGERARRDHEQDRPARRDEQDAGRC